MLTAVSTENLRRQFIESLCNTAGCKTGLLLFLSFIKFGVMPQFLAAKDDGGDDNDGTIKNILVSRHSPYTTL